MSKKQNILMVLETHIDKIILGIIILISLVFLWMYVIGNPYGEKVSIGGRETPVNPGSIDRKLKADAEKLLAGLEQPPQPGPYDVYGLSKLDDYAANMQCTVPDLAINLPIPYPGVGDAAIEEDRLYAIPVIPPLTDVQTARLRGAASVPVEEVTPGMPYASVETKLQDIDFVTVSGYFDIARLYNNFQLSFAGPGLKSSWRDTNLATPVLARVELQRRVLLQDGTNGQWQTVPRAKIDGYKKLLEQLPLKADEMQFGVDVWISQFKSPDVQLDILQPQPYEFVRSRLNWMPPEYLLETEEIMKKQKDQERREIIEERRRTREEDQRGNRPTATDRRGTTAAPRRPAAGRGADRGFDEMMMEPDLRERPARRTERTERDIERDIQNATLKSGARLEGIREPIMVWAHDDTVQPGKTYEYRIRIGVFNPITAKDWFFQDQAEYKEQTVLWSDFAVLTEPVEIPGMLHVFPMDPLSVTQADGSKNVEGVKVEVAKYFMGQWQTHAFEVYPGQPIGSVVEEKPDTALQQADGLVDVRRTAATTDFMQTETVDYASGMTMVDIVTRIVWDIRRRTDFYNMLYHDAEGLQQMGVGRSNWPIAIRSAYDRVQEEMKEEIEFRSGTMNRMREPGRRGMMEMMDGPRGL